MSAPTQPGKPTPDNAAPAAAAPPRRARGLRAQVNGLVGLLTVLFVAWLLVLKVNNLRDSVKEEVVAANRVATQLLNRMTWLAASQGTSGVLGFLNGVGRIRSNDVTLTNAQGQLLYTSPPSPYKAGRDAPDWFQRYIAPEPLMQAFEFPGGRLEVTSNASRAALDAWDELIRFTTSALALLVLVNVLVFWLVGRAVRPFGRIVRALGELESGRFDVRLPPLPGREAAAIGAAFNRMVGQLRAHIDTEKRAVLAERRLLDSRELTHWLDQHIEQERRSIARELHDELGQSVTAIRSLALAVARRVDDAESRQAAQLIADESSRLYDAMHGLIPRLAPLVLDSMGLSAALQDLAERTRRAHPDLQLSLQLPAALPALQPDAALALYRAAQEGLTNALRHGAAQRIELRLWAEGGELRLRLRDDGRGLPAQWQALPGHHGLRWLEERVGGLGGRMSVQSAAPQGVELQVGLPLQPRDEDQNQEGDAAAPHNDQGDTVMPMPRGTGKEAP
ncbi:HAMP domain-containing protein [Azohydromonas caseinilytica]|uniref:histidine kinase n=1 Tax=Azohydromonas caseinilytica TaxID=2728836 RepID=A0A848FJQ0_9BURK|nr:HAMP domain-containing protein [Azohydromonas caseinilytica]NML18450.1 HAMP domain-containing protein [Azohydromonas caseinilytica]